MKPHDYKKLKVWQEAVDLAVDTYKLLDDFPKEELYGLTAQIKRSVISIPSNIAEGAGRHTEKQFVQFLSHSNGSACELDTQLVIADRLGFMEKGTYDVFEDRINHVQRMLYNLSDRYE